MTQPKASFIDSGGFSLPIRTEPRRCILKLPSCLLTVTKGTLK